MKQHPTITTDPPVFEHVVTGGSRVVPGQSVSVREIIRRQSLGISLGCVVHHDTAVPEGMSFDRARHEALRASREAERVKSEAAAAAVGSVPVSSTAADSAGS